MALKSQPVALAIIQGHLHGYRGHQWWRSQAHMDRDLPEIVATWKQTVHGLYWPSPADSDHWLTCTGFPPENWRTALFEEISLPGFCATLLHKVKQQFHGRFQLDLRRQISDATSQRETLLGQGGTHRPALRPAAPSGPGTWTRTTDDLGHQPPWVDDMCRNNNIPAQQRGSLLVPLCWLYHVCTAYALASFSQSSP